MPEKEIAIENDEKLICESDLDGLDVGVIESLFSLGNGYIGTRGTRNIGPNDDVFENGTYMNGAYYREKINYGEAAFGFASHNNKIMTLANGKRISFECENELFKLVDPKKSLLKFSLEKAILYEEVRLETYSGKQLFVSSKIFVSQKQKPLIAIHYSITALNFSGDIVAVSKLETAKHDSKSLVHDPREGTSSTTDHMTLLSGEASKDISYLVHKIHDPVALICSAYIHEVENQKFSSRYDNQGGRIKAGIKVKCLKNSPTILNKYLHYEYALSNEQTIVEQKEHLIAHTKKSLNSYLEKGWLELQAEHELLLTSFWKNSDVVLQGLKIDQISMRLNLLHLHMSSGDDGSRNIAAKGLTGTGYDGHYFWDSEIYILPFFIFTAPSKAKSLLMFRCKTLPQARDRARQLNIKTGALFPWRTIGGEECSAYFLAGTAQYHINAAISYAVQNYVTVTGDWDFIADFGAELIFETVRIWASIGHFSETKQGEFSIDQVTGPDEYTALVNNNFYTNSMAKLHLEFACEIISKMETFYAEKFEILCQKIGLDIDEVEQWVEMARLMYLPFNTRLNINPQDDSFLDKKAWDFENTPSEKYPLLLHFHPLEIYRHQVLKQADVVLAMVLLDDRVDLKTKIANLKYYEPLTTHDSTLSACAHCILYCEIGDYESAFEYYQKTLFVDSKNSHANSHHGIHTASMGGSWLCIVQGFAGMRIRNERLYFSPNIPSNCSKLIFKIQVKNSMIEIQITKKDIKYELLSGDPILFFHNKLAINLSQSKSAVTTGLTTGDNNAT